MGYVPTLFYRDGLGSDWAKHSFVVDKWQHRKKEQVLQYLLVASTTSLIRESPMLSSTQRASVQWP
jgi:hypothetical protein